jgi:transcriptional regulator with PAS, ATPase and Fis domain
MQKPRHSDKFVEKPFDSLAIYENGARSFSTNSFDKLYNSFNSTDSKHLDKVLLELQQGLKQSCEAYVNKRISLDSAQKTIEAYVYLLNNSGSHGDSIIVQIDTANHSASTANLAPRPTLDSDQIIKKATERRLSSVFSELVGEDLHFKNVLLKAQKAAKSDFPVLIVGESGTGKEILARTIHKTSHRSNRKFVDINCAAIPDQLIDSELFGYERGAFTGANPGGRHGLFVEAHQGTLFFDEIANSSLQTQAKLLRVLNEGYFKRIGSTKNIEVNVRIISATNKDLSQLIVENHFREDLLYRLNTINLHIPPLRDRQKDMPLLVNYFLMKHAHKRQQNLTISANCFEVLESYHWPGNVRELKGVVDYMATMTNSSLITEKHFPDFLLSSAYQNLEKDEHRYLPYKEKQDGGLLPAAVRQTEKEVIREVLLQAKNKSEAIRVLGISRRTFYSKLKQYNLD